MSEKNLHDIAYQTLISLSTEEGFNASAKNEVYGCIFGRDSFITILKILHTLQTHPSEPLLEICRKSLLTHIVLQGKEFNIESGEEPGKFIHEFRRSNYHHLVTSSKPWFIYPDGVLKNYDSIDSTPLGLIALFKYWQITKDSEFLVTIMPAVEEALNWIISYGDLDKDGLLEYEFSPSRHHGGLIVQSWTDSGESLLQPDGQMPKYPIAPVEVQAYAWLALMLWSRFYLSHSPTFGKKLARFAKQMKDKFNSSFIFPDQGYFFAAQALDGDKNQIKTITSNPLLCLWSADKAEGEVESIIDDLLISDFVNRAFLPDLFVELAGMRTMSSESSTFNPNQDSYHNGSFWPILNGNIFEGLQNFGFWDQAHKLRQAALAPFEYFNSPLELYIYRDGGYLEYLSKTGQTGCHEQAWSAAAILDMTQQSIQQSTGNIHT